MKMTIVLDSNDVEGIANAAKMIEILQARLGLQTSATKEITRLKLFALFRIMQN